MKPTYMIIAILALISIVFFFFAYAFIGGYWSVIFRESSMESRYHLSGYYSFSASSPKLLREFAALQLNYKQKISRSADFSQKRTELAYAQITKDGSAIVVSDVDGNTSRIFAKKNTWFFYPRYSPDGNSLSFLSVENSDLTFGDKVRIWKNGGVDSKRKPVDIYRVSLKSERADPSNITNGKLDVIDFVPVDDANIYVIFAKNTYFYHGFDSVSWFQNRAYAKIDLPSIAFAYINSEAEKMLVDNLMQIDENNAELELTLTDEMKNRFPPPIFKPGTTLTTNTAVGDMTINVISERERKITWENCDASIIISKYGVMYWGKDEYYQYGKSGDGLSNCGKKIHYSEGQSNRENIPDYKYAVTYGNENYKKNDSTSSSFTNQGLKIKVVVNPKPLISEPDISIFLDQYYLNQKKIDTDWEYLGTKHDIIITGKGY